jgi:hypothetical protein
LNSLKRTKQIISCPTKRRSISILEKHKEFYGDEGNTHVKHETHTSYQLLDRLLIFVLRIKQKIVKRWFSASRRNGETRVRISVKINIETSFF